MIKTCSVCGNPFEVKLDPETNEVLTGAYFGKLESIKGNPEYWECPKCEAGR